MKLVGAIGTAVLSLSLGIGIPVYAEQEQHDQQEENKEKPAQETEKKAQPEKPAAHASGGRIPADRFKANFGREHRFRVSEGDYRNRRFQYGGYSFGFVSVWPSNWLYSQDVFVIENGGVYYLCNANYPGVTLTLSLTL
jgi:hypothetical protein